MIMRVGLLGHPLGHSVSPDLHHYLMTEHNQEGIYDLFDKNEDALSSFFKEFRQGLYQGCNVTIPYKQKVLSYIDDVDEYAKRISAVNTLYVQDQKIFGVNTDYLGFRDAFLKSDYYDHKKHYKSAVLMGSGGASRAIACVLQDMFFENVYVFNRTYNNAVMFCEYFNKKSHKTVFKPMLFDDRNDFIAHNNIDILINATSVGLKNKGSLHIDFSKIRNKHMICMDIVYNPLMTSFLHDAKKSGFGIIDGLDMLIYQAIPAFCLWFHVKPKEYNIKKLKTILSEKLS